MKFARIAPVLSILALLLLLVGGPGYRLGLWDLGFGLLGVMRYALFAGAGGAVLGVVFLLVPRLRAGHVTGLVAAVLVGGAVAAVPFAVRGMAADHPIHDITTDLENPPRFVAVRPLRADAPNPVAYPGDETAEQQREHYPDLEPLVTEQTASDLFEAALAAARAQGWTIVATEASDGRIEATDTTFWYGFKDDIVVRVTETRTGSRLDVRSKSRVGRSDLGKNAQRIREFLDDVEQRIAAV